MTPAMRLGFAAETRFDVECAKRGLRSEIPKEINQFDRMVTGSRGTLSVQIKTTAILHRYTLGRPDKFAFVYVAPNRRANATKTHFSAAGVDVIAFYIVPLDRWHIFPAGQFKGKNIKVRANPTGPMRVATNNWALLGAAPVGELDFPV